MSNPICLRCQKEQSDKNFCYTCFKEFRDIRESYEEFMRYPCLSNYTGDRCTFSLTGRNYYNQLWYKCATCFPSCGKGVCWFCAKDCQDKGHNLTFVYGSFFCDKGDALYERQLKASRPPPRPQRPKDKKCIIL